MTENIESERDEAREKVILAAACLEVAQARIAELEAALGHISQMKLSVYEPITAATLTAAIQIATRALTHQKTAGPEMLEALKFVSTDPCFKVLGSVTQDEVRAAIAKVEGHQSPEIGIEP